MRLSVLRASIAGAVVFFTLNSAMAEEDRFGVVVLVDEKEIVIDKGGNEGLKHGDKVSLYRLLTVHHPVSGENITDRFPIGDLKVAESSELLSIILNSKTLSHPPKVGDLVKLPNKPPVKPATEAPIAKASASPLTVSENPELALLTEVMEGTLGQPIINRIARFDYFLEQYPNGTYRTAVTSEIQWLRRAADDSSSGNPNATGTPIPTAKEYAVRVLHTQLGRLQIGDAVEVVIAVVPASPATRCHLYLRKNGTAGYDGVEMKRDGAYYYRAQIPPAYLEKRGSFVYFIELSHEKSEPVAVVGSSQSAIHVSVSSRATDKRVEKDRSLAQMSFEYINFDADGTVDDEYWNVESDFFYRTFGFLYGLRVGMGFFNGTGGDLAAIEESTANNEHLAALYGYVEGEFEVVPMFHFMVRGLAGNQRSPKDDQSRASGVFGLEGGVRIGEERKTNLVLAGAIFERVGYEGRIALGINHFRKIPITVEGLVTNFPVVDSNLGMRLVVGVGYRFTDSFALLLRGSWNGRTIKHTGFGGGASLVLGW